MRRSPAYGVAAGAALALAGCAGGPGDVAGPAVAATPQAGGDPVSHDERRLVVEHETGAYRVNVRYIGLLGRSVVAVREGAKDADGWDHLGTVEGRATVPAEAPFADDAYRAVAVEIAETVSRNGDVCPEGARLSIARDEGEAETMYRRDRSAWVVFAACTATAG